MWKFAFCIVSFSNGQLHYLDLISFRVEHPASGRFLEMYSTEPGVQFYTAYYLNETGKGGAKYEKFGAFCLEAQHYPDSPNKVSCRLSKIFNFLLGSGYWFIFISLVLFQPNFPTTLLAPGETYLQTTTYKFGVLWSLKGQLFTSWCLMLFCFIMIYLYIIFQ